MTRSKRSSKTTILSVALICVSVLIILATSLAYFTDKKFANDSLSFGKVELSEGTKAGITKRLIDVLPGDVIIDDKLSITKSNESENIFVRAKISFESESTNVSVISFLNELRSFKTSEFNVSTETIEGTNAKWSEKRGNYIYLVNDANKMYSISDTKEYVLTDSIVLPTSFKGDGSQYFEEITLNFEWQAIQGTGVDDTIEGAEVIFNQLFAESSFEKLPPQATFDTNGGDVVLNNLFANKGVVTMPTYLGEKSVSLKIDSAEQSAQTSLLGWEDEQGNFYYPNEEVQITENSVFTAVWPSSNISYSVVNGVAKAIEVTEEAGDLFVAEYLTINGEKVYVESIGEYAFCENHNINTVVLPSHLKTIEQFGIFDTNIETLIIPEGVTEIATYGVGNNYNLKNLTVPTSVTTFGDFAFHCCVSLENVKYENSGEDYEFKDGKLTLSGSGEFGGFIGWNGLIQTVDWGTSNYTSIAGYNGSDSGFLGASAIKEITIPASIQSVGFMGLSNMDGLKSITILNSSISMEKDAVLADEFLETINFTTSGEGYSFNNGVLTLTGTGTYAGHFGWNGLIKEVDWSTSSYTELGTDCFTGAIFTEISIPSGVTNIGDSAFCSCYNLVKAIVPDTVVSFNPGGAFWQSGNLKEVVLPDMTTWGLMNFAECSSLVYINIMSTLNSIGTDNFGSCENLKYVLLDKTSTDTITYNGTETNIVDAIIATGSNMIEKSELYFVTTDTVDGANWECVENTLLYKATVNGVEYVKLNNKIYKQYAE